tara:strand:- start:279 stop:656 length:378 start_codon:yes stop_codon:yes gene_type:complete
MITANVIASYDNAMKRLNIGKRQNLRDAIQEYHKMNTLSRKYHDESFIQEDYAAYFDNLVEKKLMQLDAINNLFRHIECIKGHEERREKDIEKISQRKDSILKLLDSITVAEDGDPTNKPDLRYI